MQPRSLFSLAEHLDRLSKDGDPLEALAGTAEFERFRPLLTRGLGYSDGAKGGRPATYQNRSVERLLANALD